MIAQVRDVATDVILTTEQEAAIAAIEQGTRLVVIAGPAGTGKSTVSAEITRRFSHKRIAIAAPTHKAVHVLREHGAEAETIETIHAMAGLKLLWRNGARKLIRAGQDKADGHDLLIVDEASMLTDELLRATLRCNVGQIALVGDRFQIPPVAEGAKVVDSPAFDAGKLVRLETVHRQAEGSPIITLATHLRQMMERRWLRRRVLEVVDDWRKSHPLGDALVFYESRAEWVDSFVEKLRSGDPIGLSRRNRMLAYRNPRVDALGATVRSQIFEDAAEYQPGDLIVMDEQLVSPYLDPDRHNRKLTEEATARTPIDIGPYDHSETTPLIFNNEEVAIIRALYRPDVPVTEAVGDQTFAARLSIWYLTIEARAGQVMMRVIARDSLKDARALVRAVKDAAKASHQWRPYYALIESFGAGKHAFSQTVHKSQGSTFDECWVDLADISANGAELGFRLAYTALTRARHRVDICLEAWK